MSKRKRSSFGQNMSQLSPSNITKDSVDELLMNIVTGNGRELNIVACIRNLLRRINEDTPDVQHIRREILTFCIKQMNIVDVLTRSECKDLVWALLSQITYLDDATMIFIVEHYMELIKEGKITNGISLELFPRILENIGSKPFVMDAKGVKQDGMLLKSDFINSLFSCRWSPKCILHIVSMARDIQLTPEESKFLIEKLLRVMKSLLSDKSYDELPPLVHQLLIMPSKDHAPLVLEGILDLFSNIIDHPQSTNNEENDDLMEVTSGHNTDVLYRIEGTVLLHISTTLKHDTMLRSEFFKGLKTAANSTSTDTLYSSPFAIAVSLSLTGLSETVFDHLKSIVIKSFKLMDDQKTSSWIRELTIDECVGNIEQIFITIIEQSVHGWDPVLEGLFNFSFDLLDTFSPKISSASNLNYPGMKACRLAGTILIKSFERHSIIRSEVLNQLINRILANATSHCVDPHISIIAEVSRSVPQVILDSIQQLKDCLTYINGLPSASAVHLIQALLPLVQYKSSVRDSLLIVLRKLLFSRELECRLTAVNVYLLLLKHFKVLGMSSHLSNGGSDSSQSSHYSYSSQSQTMVEIHGGSSSDGLLRNDSNCLEILGILRRCFTQQDKVKLSLYEGMYDVICHNDKLSGPVLELLLNHFKKFYEKDTDLTPPVNLKDCVSSPSEHGYIRKEPLAHLVCCIQRCLRRCSQLQEAPPTEVIRETKSVLMSLANRLVTTELSEYELDRSSDYSSSSVGTKNSILATMVMGLNETLMDFVFTDGNYSLESCELTLKLFNNYQAINELLTEKCGGGVAGRRGAASTVGQSKTPCLLPMASTVYILKAMFSDELPAAHQISLKKLKDSVSLMKYLVSVTHIKISQIGSQAYPWEWGSRTLSSMSQKNFENGCIIARLLMNYLENPFIQETGKKEKGKTIHEMCLEGFLQLSQTVFAHYSSSHIDRFLLSLHDQHITGDSVPADVNIQDVTLDIIKKFQELINDILSEQSEFFTIKDVTSILNIIKILIDRLDPQSAQIKEVYRWFSELCEKQNIEDISIVKSLVTMILSLSHSIDVNLKLIKGFACDVHFNIGDLNDDVEFQGPGNFKVVSSRTALPSVFTPLLESIDHLLSELLIIIKTSQTTINDDEGDSERLMSALCNRCLMFVTTFNELVETKIPINGQYNELLTKSLTKFYGLLTEIAKIQQSFYAVVREIFPPFRKLMDSVGKDLSQQVYTYILYIQETQVSIGEQALGKGGGKKGKQTAAKSGRSKVRKEMRTIPNLIYSMEQLESVLIRLSKKSKEDLLEKFKRSTARDFRIKDRELDEILNEQENEKDDDEDEDSINKDDERSNQELTPPPTKRAKKTKSKK